MSDIELKAGDQLIEPAAGGRFWTVLWVKNGMVAARGDATGEHRAAKDTWTPRQLKAWLDSGVLVPVSVVPVAVPDYWNTFDD